jgi:parvulin-like peptidyl-prolyl isomerase
MARFGMTGNWALAVVPGFLWVLLAGCADKDVEPTLLARVGDKEITVSDLEAFETRLLRAEKMNAYDKAAFEKSLETLVEREILLLEARQRALAKDARVRQWMDNSERRELAEEMMRRNVLRRAEVKDAEVKEVFAKGWNERIDVLEIYVLSSERAAEVVELVGSGVDFAAVGRSHSLDINFGFPAGRARPVSYYPYSNPREMVQTLFTLRQGQVSSPLPFMRGQTINKIVDRVVVPFEEVEEGIREGLWKEKRRLLRGVYLQELNIALELKFEDGGIEQVVDRLRSDRQRGQSKEAQANTQEDEVLALSFGDRALTVVELAELVRPASNHWPEINADAVITELKNNYLPERLMAADARRQGVDSDVRFVAWRQKRLEDMLLRRLQELFAEEQVTADEDEIQDYYAKNKKRYSIMARAWVKDLLVDDADLAERLATQARAGADLDSLIALHGVRENVPSSGVIRVFPVQATIYGKAWMDTVMQAPLDSVRGPVQGKGGYSVLKVTQRQEESFYTLEQKRVRRSAIQAISEQKEHVLFNEYLTSLRRKHAKRIQTYPDNLENMRKMSLERDK